MTTISSVAHPTIHQDFHTNNSTVYLDRAKCDELAPHQEEHASRDETAPIRDKDLPPPHEVCMSLLQQLGLGSESVPLSILGSDPVVPSVHRIGTAASAVLGALGAVMSLIQQERTGVLDSVRISVDEAVMQLSAAFYTTVNGVGLIKLFDDPALFRNCGFYQTGDGRWIFLITIYPHLQQTACEVLACPPGRQHFTQKIAAWSSAFELEQAICARGGCAAVIRTRSEWDATEQGRICAGQELVLIEKIADSEPEPLPPIKLPEKTNPLDPDSSGAPLPLSDIRILDNTHVIAGPMAARIAAEHGASVLHMSSPAHPDPPPLVHETGLGKRNFYCDLSSESDATDFWDLIEQDQVDVYICNYLSLERKGFGPAEMAKRRPGIVFVDFHCYGRDGPWFGRGGFDQLACAATGFYANEAEAMIEHEHEREQQRQQQQQQQQQRAPSTNPTAASASLDSTATPTTRRPRLPPSGLLNDYLAGMLALAGAGAALLRRHREGGSWRVHVNLARVCTWVQDLGRLERKAVDGLPTPRPDLGYDHPALRTVRGPCGEAKYLPTRIHYSGSIRPRLEGGAEPLGASRLAELRREVWKKRGEEVSVRRDVEDAMSAT